jgi:nucleotide-binding universal stress UspA family protein
MRRILVPTDGSPESEKALPVATTVASAQDAEVVLVSVIDEIPIVAPGYGATSAAIYEEILRNNEDAARAHLEHVAARLTAAGVRVRTAVRRGPTAAALLDWETEEAPDLLVMATHGRTGIARFALGSVADRMVRDGSVPVLLVRSATPTTTRLETALVMLDGSGVAEQVLPMVEQLAGKPLQSVTLYRVVANLDDEDAAMHYLEGVRARLATTALGVKTVVEVGDPRRTARKAASRTDLVILYTHGRGGVDRLRHGSVAEFVVRDVEQPTLLVRAGATTWVP